MIINLGRKEQARERIVEEGGGGRKQNNKLCPDID